MCGKTVPGVGSLSPPGKATHLHLLNHAKSSSFVVKRHLLYGDWSYQQWREEHLKEYLKMCTLFKEELELTNKSNNRPFNHPVEDINL
jgi:hypothetical protein